jgi:hypothetical protein
MAREIKRFLSEKQKLWAEKGFVFSGAELSEGERKKSECHQNFS